jgi:hypothetical protein
MISWLVTNSMAPTAQPRPQGSSTAEALTMAAPQHGAYRFNQAAGHAQQHGKATAVAGGQQGHGRHQAFGMHWTGCCPHWYCMPRHAPTKKPRSSDKLRGFGRAVEGR